MERIGTLPRSYEVAEGERVRICIEAIGIPVDVTPSDIKPIGLPLEITADTDDTLEANFRMPAKRVAFTIVYVFPPDSSAGDPEHYRVQLKGAGGTGDRHKVRPNVAGQLSLRYVFHSVS